MNFTQQPSFTSESTNSNPLTSGEQDAKDDADAEDEGADEGGRGDDEEDEGERVQEDDEGEEHEEHEEPGNADDEGESEGMQEGEEGEELGNADDEDEDDEDGKPLPPGAYILGEDPVARLFMSQKGNVLSRRLHYKLRAVLNLARDRLEEYLYVVDAFPDRQGRHKYTAISGLLVDAAKTLKCQPVHTHLMNQDLVYARLLVRHVSSNIISTGQAHNCFSSRYECATFVKVFGRLWHHSLPRSSS